MRILHIGKFYFPYRGGMETVVKSMAEGLHEQGHDITVLCANERFKFEREIINGVKVLRTPTIGILFSQPLAIFLPFFLFKYAKKYDAIHFHSPNPLIEFFSNFISHPNKHSMHHSDIVRQKILGLIYNPFYKLFLSKMKSIFVPTTNHIKYSKSVLEYKDKCQIIPFFIDEKRFYKDEKVINAIENYRDQYGRFGLFVGRLVEYKGLRILLKAAKEVDHKLIIVGKGPLEDELKNLIKQYHLEDKVFLLGRIDSPIDFSAIYHACHYVVLPSITPNENFGMIQLEGMYCEKPIITTDLKSGVPAVGIKDETTLIVTPNNAGELASDMTRVVNDEVLSKRLGKNGKKLYISKYQKKTVIRKSLEIYGYIPSTSKTKKEAA